MLSKVLVYKVSVENIHGFICSVFVPIHSKYELESSIRFEDCRVSYECVGYKDVGMINSGCSISFYIYEDDPKEPLEIYPEDLCGYDEYYASLLDVGYRYLSYRFAADKFKFETHSYQS